ncbi:membrane protein insertase YidC [Bordetella avium]|uniref:Membrane protein insertase YidC n=1 Tax=Bordetella avium (strain 197N) TaxID=360910 RepID=YIDC_BORA1|nr:membrane protein insertase YidC [Bordetella avium]Q2KTI5.1 RecName: Full=Membrane protein insertase YidC; AltName: Full=Foldase YidC; AltName: Full=Membrane integrase YidC; AltName: Full=Membrane protein YidC [Bordetella avium 197N]AZY50733.1 membrane protein insertase YidC [Bordetella avium]AZY54128.1 membrane protein insertase YidC [Bordetella avium]RIQ15100.1 membrane protein insertase YidC [Bordetella avium]RIQ20102.1 membrane protein insertase YidC [Bordetella avium]RIQ34682.1 membran
MDIRRTVLWMIFSFSLLLLWNNWQIHNGQPALFGGPSPEQNAPATANNQAATNPASNTPAVPNAPAATSAPSSVPGSTAPAPAQAQEVVITTDVLRLTFSSTGAQIIRAELLKYPATAGSDQPMVLLDRSAGLTYTAQTGVIGAGQNFPTHLTPFAVTTNERELTGDKLVVRFEAESGGLRVIKTFTLDRGSYDVHVRHDVTNVGTAAQHPSVYLQLERDGNDPAGTSSFYHTFTGVAVYSEQDKFQKVTFSDIAKNKASYIKQADNGWIGIVQHYFATAWVPKEGTPRTNDLLQLQPNLFAARAIEALGEVAPGATVSSDAQLWVGPQDQQAMAAVAPGLELVVDYGWLTIIAKPLFTLMTWLHSLLGNWGWTIVALTVIIKAVFYPLASASYRSMARMKQVAPRLQALKEKYGDDRQKLNQAMMEMYRTEKINPLGGCLPMVVQIPVFIALYWVLLASVEMRGAPWILWIHDLSVRDPYFILPAVMMATMFLQIKLNPTPPDPVQAKVMMVMPLVFGGMMFFFPAGLVLYWCVNNTLSILQQWSITRSITRQTAKRG